MNKIAIIGYGELGKAIHKILRNKTDLIINVWDKKDQKNKLGETVSLAEIVFVCVPSWCAKEALENIKKYLNKNSLVVCLAKGIEPITLKTIDVVLKEGLAQSRSFGILSGPMLAEELMANKKGFAVAALKNKKDFIKLSEIFNRTNLSIEYSNDLRGVALCGGLKNIYALGLGIADGLELGNNSKGKLSVLVINEMLEIVKALGGKEKTVLSIAGIGDLIATGFSKYSRNRETGEELAKTGTCCLESEGSKSIGSMAKLLGKKSEKLAFFDALKTIVLNSQNPRDIFKLLLK